jgi:chromate transport protein ChrA
LRGVSGAVVALFAASIPCTMMVVVLTALFSHWQENQFAQSAIHGAIAAAVAITVKTVWTLRSLISRAASESECSSSARLRSRCTLSRVCPPLKCC